MQFSTFSDIMTEMTQFLSVISKKFCLWPKNHWRKPLVACRSIIINSETCDVFSAESAGSSRDLENFPSLSKRRRGRSKPLSPIQDNRQSDGGVAGGCGPDEAPASGAWRDDVGGVVDYVAEGQVAPKAESSTSHPANADTHPGPERTSSPPWPASQPVPGPTSAGGARKATRLVIVNLGTSAADLKERSRQKNAAAREAAAEEGSSSQVGMDKADDTCQVSVVDGRLATDDAGKPVSVKVGGKDYYLVRAKDADGKNTSFCLVAAEDYQKRSAEWAAVPVVARWRLPWYAVMVAMTLGDGCHVTVASRTSFVPLGTRSTRKPHDTRSPWF